MKIMIASDIHGSAKYCAKLTKLYERSEAEKLVLLGDILYHGPRNALPDEYDPKKVCDILNPYKNDILCVRGNCDSEVDGMVLDFSVSSDSALLFFCGHTAFATHGHIYNENNLPPLGKRDILLHGHTHVPVYADRGGYIYINPGSVSIPKENSPHSCVIIEDEIVMHVALDGECFMKNIL